MPWLPSIEARPTACRITVIFMMILVFCLGLSRCDGPEVRHNESSYLQIDFVEQNCVRMANARNWKTGMNLVGGRYQIGGNVR